MAFREIARSGRVVQSDEPVKRGCFFVGLILHSALVVFLVLVWFVWVIHPCDDPECGAMAAYLDRSVVASFVAFGCLLLALAFAAFPTSPRSSARSGDHLGHGARAGVDIPTLPQKFPKFPKFARPQQVICISTRPLLVATVGQVYELLVATLDRLFAPGSSGSTPVPPASA
jgi:hypothetical protein